MKSASTPNARSRKKTIRLEIVATSVRSPSLPRGARVLRALSNSATAPRTWRTSFAVGPSSWNDPGLYCKGQYSSGYMPARYHLGSEIRKAYTACSDGGSRSWPTTPLWSSSSGAILRFGAGGAQSAMAPEAVPRAERLEDAALRSVTARQR